MKIHPIEITRSQIDLKDDLEYQISVLEKRLVVSDNKLHILNAIERLKTQLAKINKIKQKDL